MTAMRILPADLTPDLARPHALRFLARTKEDENGCFVYQGALHKRSGYAKVTIYGSTYNGHRVVYLGLRGSIPPGFAVDHLCRNRACIWPDHLEAVTTRENILRGTSPAAQYAQRDSCKYGHAFTPANTRIGKDGSRECRACQRRWQKARRQAVAAERVERCTRCGALLVYRGHGRRPWVCDDCKAPRSRKTATLYAIDALPVMGTTA